MRYPGHTADMAINDVTRTRREATRGTSDDDNDSPQPNQPTSTTPPESDYYSTKTAPHPRTLRGVEQRPPITSDPSLNGPFTQNQVVADDGSRRRRHTRMMLDILHRKERLKLASGTQATHST